MHLLCHPLHKQSEAFSAQLIEEARLLIEKGIDLNAKSFNRHPVVEYESEIFAEFEYELSTYGSNPLHYLCASSLASCAFWQTQDNILLLIKLMIDNGIDVKATDDSTGSNGLHLLCKYYTNGNIYDIIRLLIQKGVDPETKNKLGFTPLHHMNQRRRQFQEGKLFLKIIQLLTGVESKRCAHCNSFKEGMKHCARCKNISYCDANCQRANWRKHKPNCH